MFDKQKIIRMTAELENFVRTFPNIYILPEVFSANVLSLLKRLNANVVAIITNNPQQNVIRMPSGEYQLTNLQTLLQNFNEQTSIIVSSAKQVDNPIFATQFDVGNIKIGLPTFALTDEEALAIYDRVTTIQVLKQYQNDGISTNVKDIPIRFARGMSTFIDSQFQDVKVQFWDRRDFKIPSYDEVDDAAIVMQGPLEYKDNYTITTARLYRQWYPNAPIVISTWKNEATENFRNECRKIGVVLLENDVPAEPGWRHTNYQLESSFKGVEYVKNNTPAKFALKCRTDQRINRLDFLLYFKNMLKTFPPRDNKLNARILLLGVGWKWFPFFLTDFIYFGDIEDMNKLLGIPKQTTFNPKYGSSKRWGRISKIISPRRHLPNLKLKNDRKLRNFNITMSRCIFPEIFILTSFYKQNIGVLDSSKFLQTYWKFLKEYLIIVNHNDILLDWPKYAADRYRDTYSIPSYYDRGIDFARWLDIYLNYKDEDEI